MALGNLDNRGLRRAFGRKVLRQLLPQQAGMRPDDAVFAAVISRRAMKDVHADLLFRCGFGGFFQGAFSDIEKKFTQPQRAAEVTAGNDPFNQSRPRVEFDV